MSDLPCAFTCNPTASMKDQEPRRRSAQEFVDLVPKAVSRAALAVVQAASLARALGSTRAAADRRQGRSLGT